MQNFKYIQSFFLLLFLVLVPKIGFTANIDAYPSHLINIPTGAFVHGSDSVEREVAYRLDEKAYGHSRTRKDEWYDTERPKTLSTSKSYEIMVNLVSNADYNTFVQETGYAAPNVDKKTWQGYGLIHPYKETLRFLWKNGSPPKGRELHPVVLVSWLDAKAYADWLSAKTGESWHLPTELQWEKAARGTDGRYFPWGNKYDPLNLNSHDAGPFDTLPVGQFKKGISPFGMLDAAGQVFEWTQSQSVGERYIVKGGSWDDRGCGVCRPAARHSRPRSLKHILVGFRLVREIN